MPPPSPSLPLYRRIRSDQWEDDGRPSLNAFNVREWEPGLSVYQVDKPRLVFEYCIEDWMQRLHSGDPAEALKARKLLSRHGDTPEKMIENGWGVVRLNYEEVLGLGFTVGPIGARQHRTILGSRELFQLNILELRDLAKRLHKNQCLKR